MRRAKKCPWCSEGNFADYAACCYCGLGRDEAQRRRDDKEPDRSPCSPRRYPLAGWFEDAALDEGIVGASVEQQGTHTNDVTYWRRIRGGHGQ